MQERWTSRVERRRFYLTGVALALFLSWGASPCAQEMRDNEGFLVGVLLKSWTLKERAVADIQMSNQKIQANDRMIEEAEKRMSNALETFNDQAVFAAREPLMKARADGRKIKQTRARLDLTRTRAESRFAAVRNLLVSGQGEGSDSLICGLVSLKSGKVRIIRKDGNKVELDRRRPGFLGPGDEIMTMGRSNAEVQVLDGRAAVQLDEHSRLKLEEEGRQEQVLQLLQGEVYCAIDKVDDFAAMLQASAGQFEADQDLKEVMARNNDRIMKWTNMKFTMHTLSACCSATGTRFSIGLTNSGGTEVAIYEGTGEVGDAKCTKQVPVQQGFKVIVTKDGISEPQKVADIEQWWEK